MVGVLGLVGWVRVEGRREVVEGLWTLGVVGSARVVGGAGSAGELGIPGKAGKPGRRGRTGRAGGPVIAAMVRGARTAGSLGIAGMVRRTGKAARGATMGEAGRPGTAGLPGMLGEPGRAGDAGKRVEGAEPCETGDRVEGRAGFRRESQERWLSRCWWRHGDALGKGTGGCARAALGLEAVVGGRQVWWCGEWFRARRGWSKGSRSKASTGAVGRSCRWADERGGGSRWRVTRPATRSTRALR